MQSDVNTAEEPVHPDRTKRFIRSVVVLLFGALTALFFAYETQPLLQWIYQTVRPAEAKSVPWFFAGVPMAISIAASGILGFIVGALLMNLAINVFGRLLEHWDNMDSGDKVTLFLGVFAGLIASVPFIFLFNSIFSRIYIPLAILAVTIGFTTLAVYALQSMAEILPWTKAKARRRRNIKILDTNVIIDGRIYDLARTGFLEGQLYVPGFVLEELQYIADSHDQLRRQRGRRGLDVLRHLQGDFQLEIRTQDKLAPDIGDGVDARLVRLARAMGADIVTNDFNLNRVAVLQEVNVLNINDLALSLRPNVLPQETLMLTVVREGNQHGQGVGYLEDGTMVVVENGKAHIGENICVVVTQVIQTERGKMIFGEFSEEPESHGALPPMGEDHHGSGKRPPRNGHGRRH